MGVLAIQCSPNEEGLTSRIARAVVEGVRESGVQAEMVHLNKLSIQHCRACGAGWGHHWDENPKLKKWECVVQDDFAALHERVLAADGLIISTPVYFHDVSESAKAFLDRLRRCEWRSRGEEPRPLDGKPVVLIAAAGGSGNGAPEALSRLDDYLVKFLGMKRVAELSVIRANEKVEAVAAHEAGKMLAGMAGR